MWDEQVLKESEEDRRGYFRIEDRVHLDFEVIAPESLPGRLEKLENGTYKINYQTDWHDRTFRDCLRVYLAEVAENAPTHAAP